MRPIVRRVSDEDGATLVLVALMLAALMSVVALAVDVGMLMTARSEAQRTADAAALAAAGYLIYNPGDEDGARQTAINLAAVNSIIGDPVEMLPEDLTFDLEAGRVVAIVRRTQDRGNPMATWFARVFGVDVVDVSARAAAEIASAHGAVCMKPWTIPDGWYDADGDGHYDADGVEYYDPYAYGYGTESGSDFRNSLPNSVYTDNGIDPPGTAYDKDRGRPVKLKDEGAQSSSWYFLWDMPQEGGGPTTGANRYRWNIVNCNPSLIELGQEYLLEPGAKVGPTIKGVKELYDADPYAEWDLATGMIIKSEYDPPESSPRVVRIPLFDPTTLVDLEGENLEGRQPVVFTNMTAFFIIGVQGNSDVVGRFMAMSGVGAATGPTMPSIQYARLVE